jgi:PilZ domain-containing protein
MNTKTQIESRRSERTPVSIPVRLVLPADHHSTACDARLIDISAHGARIRTDTPLHPGQVVELIPSQGPRYGVHGRVVWFVPPEAGIELLETGAKPPWSR